MSSQLPAATTAPAQERRTSFNFLRRQKSADKTMNKKQKGQQAPAIPRAPPQLPSHPQIDPNSIGSALGVDTGRPDAYTAAVNSYRGVPYGVPMPPMPSSSPSSKNGDYVDPYARTESMTHRGRYSYASSAISTTGINSPRRVRRRKDPTPFK
jgi:hypothetical protein